MTIKTEDMVRDEAKIILDFQPIPNGKCGVGQLTTFNQLGFLGINDKPDGWYLPNLKSEVAIILEAKSSDKNISDIKWINELTKNIKITESLYKKVIGILFNGSDTIVIKDGQIFSNNIQLQDKNYYIGLFNNIPLDKQKIYSTTKTINDILHFKFGIQNLKHRMIFTSCALVAKNLGAFLSKGMNFHTLHTSILSEINKSYVSSNNVNSKLDKIGIQFAGIKCNFSASQKDLDDFIEAVLEISNCLNSSHWKGEDVMGIFFNEFTRYVGKTEQGQVLTPDHITSLVYRITETTYKDHVLDACCGTGAFLVKAMCNMIEEVGGNNTTEANKIKTERLFGIERDIELHAVTCANMLIHKDGKTNIENDDSTTDTVGKWIKSKKITKVLMNPPFERKHKCLHIVKNVLDNVEDGAICAFILPDRKLEVGRKTVEKWFKQHTLLKIIKLPEDIFDEGVTTSIFIFQAHKKQNNKDIFCCYIENDGLVRVKNQGRHDINNEWLQSLEDYWVKIIDNKSGDNSIKFINPETDELCYPVKNKTIPIYTDKDFNRTMLEYVLHTKNLDVSDFIEKAVSNILYEPNSEKIDIKKQIKDKINDNK